jgi:hypothetical protein
VPAVALTEIRGPMNGSVTPSCAVRVGAMSAECQAIKPWPNAWRSAPSPRSSPTFARRCRGRSTDGTAAAARTAGAVVRREPT